MAACAKLVPGQLAFSQALLTVYSAFRPRHILLLAFSFLSHSLSIVMETTLRSGERGAEREGSAVLYCEPV